VLGFVLHVCFAEAPACACAFIIAAMSATNFTATASRDNNFDAIRILAASFVILSHSWALVKDLDEPIAVITRACINGGALGVWMFFVISGYLVSQSFVQRAHFGAFAAARVLRIAPAYIACIVIGVLIGAIVTTLPRGEYWRHPLTWDYVLNNLRFELRYDLPGVFESNPYPKSVNGSIWTLPAETMMYVGVAVLGVLTVLDQTRAKWGVLLLVGLLVLLSVSPALVTHIPYIATEMYTPAVRCFLLGVLAFLLRDKLPLHGGIVLLLLLLLPLTGQHRPPGTLLTCILIAYTTLWLAFHPRWTLRVPERIGDISYGLYVYAFPVQQFIVWTSPAISAWAVFVSSFFGTALLAWLSWHGIEKRALRLKCHFKGLGSN
jgi:peptidoglycan/LPS O-acetylase OafA/YrhL